MKRSVWIGGVAALALVWSGSVGAQSSSSPQQSSSQSTITVTGCLERGEAMAGGSTGTTGSTSTSSANDRFVLKNAHTGAGTSSTAGTAGATTSGTSGTAMSGSTYALEGSASDLQSHVGHEVEIHGRLETSSSSSATAGTAPSGSSASSTKEQRLQVESVRMVSSTCSSK